jgi:glycine/D-amino acid oxidase-like deaminating enzyme
MASFELDDLLHADMSQEELKQLADEILRRASVILPDLIGSAVESFTVGVRSIPQDGFPIVGPVPGVEGFYVVVTHSGVTMGPFLGRIAADEILTGQIDERIAHFRVDRRPGVTRSRKPPVT